VGRPHLVRLQAHGLQGSHLLRSVGEAIQQPAVGAAVRLLQPLAQDLKQEPVGVCDCGHLPMCVCVCVCACACLCMPLCAQPWTWLTTLLLRLLAAPGSCCARAPCSPRECYTNTTSAALAPLPRHPCARTCPPPSCWPRWPPLPPAQGACPGPPHRRAGPPPVARRCTGAHDHTSVGRHWRRTHGHTSWGRLCRLWVAMAGTGSSQLAAHGDGRAGARQHGRGASGHFPPHKPMAWTWASTFRPLGPEE